MIKTVRRYRFIKQKLGEEISHSALGPTWQKIRLDTPGTEFPVDLPWQQELLNADYLVLEEVDGAPEEELVKAGLSRKQAQDIVQYFEE